MKVLLTGSSKGIGAAILKKLLEAGHDVTVVNRSDISKNMASNVKMLKCDLSDLDQVKNLCEIIGSEKYDALINNAGGGKPQKLQHIQSDEIVEELNLNLVAPLMLMKSVLPNMENNKFGRIVNISSISSKRGVPYLFVYSAAKSGLDSLTQSISKCFSEKGITVNSICPGGVDTEMAILGRGTISEIYNLKTEDYQNNMVKQVGLGRMVTAEEVADIVSFLLTDKADCITGQAINVCGNLEVI